MLKNLTNVTVALLGAVATSAATLPAPSIASASSAVQPPFSIIQEESVKTQETATKEVAPEPVKPKEKRLVCRGCNENEKYVFDALKNKGITDKKAIATVMANIKQESGFIPNICEGGSRVSYHQCNGGVGILQWTNASRYYGLGEFAKKNGGNPSSLETQVRYMFYESDWKMIEDGMKTPGLTITDYQRLAYKWIRYGHKGPREHYANQYLKKFQYEVNEG